MQLALQLLRKTAENHRWRQQRCVNLIPSEMTASPLARLASGMDPAFRYAEHKEVEAFCDSDVFYYQGRFDGYRAYGLSLSFSAIDWFGRRSAR